MSIFKQSFPEFVQRQIALREKLIGIGTTRETNTGGNGDRLLTRRTQSRTTKSTSINQDITIDAGLSYNYLFNKQCVIRMTSMADYVENVNLDIGDLEGDVGFERLKGGTLAQNFILQGGVLSDFARNIKGERRPKRVTTPRDGFPRPGQKTNLSYGDFALGSDATSDGFGIVPMPGIIDVNIRTKSAYGSLREAKINFVCHNKRQLEVLEMLYMRPGIPILVEWGWSPYVILNDSDVGELVTTFNTVESEVGERLFSPEITQNDIYFNIEKLRKKSQGNYDGMLGYIKNFGFQARPDGGFDCFTELISVGEVLDVLKNPNTSKLQIKPKTNASDKESDENTVLYNGLSGLIQSLYNITTSEESQIEAAIGARYGDDGWKSGLLRFVEAAEAAIISTAGFGVGFLLVKAYDEYINDNASSQVLEKRKGIIDSIVKILKLTKASQIYNFIIMGGDPENISFVSYDFKNPFENAQNLYEYVRWDLLCDLINEQFIPSNDKGLKLVSLIPDRIIEQTKEPTQSGDESIVFEIDPLLYGTYDIDPSGNPDVCILPHQFNQLGTNQNILKNVPDTSFWQPLTNIEGIIPTINITQTFDIKYKGKYYSNSPDNFPLDKKDKDRRIGNIFISVSYLFDIVEKNKNNKDYALGKFIQDIWKGINEACPNHNFVLVDNKESSTCYIMDLPVDNTSIPRDNELFVLTPYSNETILRDFNYESHVPSALTATIAIQAQDPKSVEDIEGVTYVAFNRAIKNRLASKNTKSHIEETQENIRNNVANFVNERETLRNELTKYERDFFKFLQNASNENNTETTKEKIGVNRSGQLKKYQGLSSYTELVSDTKSTPGNAVIPLSFNATLDGISGLVKGNVFKIDQERLPKAYSNANIGFILFGEEQSITAGQDWTTKIDGKMTILNYFDSTTYLKNAYTEELVVDKIQGNLQGVEILEIDEDLFQEFRELNDKLLTLVIYRNRLIQQLKGKAAGASRDLTPEEDKPNK
jgi:hypothetical protein